MTPTHWRLLLRLVLLTRLSAVGLSESTCRKDRLTFACDSVTCIPETWHCDGEDCPNGVDEWNCNTLDSCNANQFACTNGSRCVPRHWLCDDEWDCSDGSDEAVCEQPSATTINPVQPTADSVSTSGPTTDGMLLPRATNSTRVHKSCGQNVHLSKLSTLAAIIMVHIF